MVISDKLNAFRRQHGRWPRDLVGGAIASLKARIAAADASVQPKRRTPLLRAWDLFRREYIEGVKLMTNKPIDITNSQFQLEVGLAWHRQPEALVQMYRQEIQAQAAARTAVGTGLCAAIAAAPSDLAIVPHAGPIGDLVPYVEPGFEQSGIVPKSYAVENLCGSCDDILSISDWQEFLTNPSTTSKAQRVWAPGIHPSFLFRLSCGIHDTVSLSPQDWNPHMARMVNWE